MLTTASVSSTLQFLGLVIAGNGQLRRSAKLSKPIRDVYKVHVEFDSGIASVLVEKGWVPITRPGTQDNLILKRTIASALYL